MREKRFNIFNNEIKVKWFEKLSLNRKLYSLIGIVYYALGEEKTWTVHISRKLTPELKVRVANTRCGMANFTPVERILFIHHTRAENTTFAFLSRERKCHFRTGYGEKLCTQHHCTFCF